MIRDQKIDNKDRIVDYTVRTGELMIRDQKIDYRNWIIDYKEQDH
jgi:hypothetical protein